jgi:hypothetical protein
MDYIRALAHGMPPARAKASGSTASPCFSPIPIHREVILFPLLRPEATGQAAPRAPPIPRSRMQAKKMSCVAVGALLVSPYKPAVLWR